MTLASMTGFARSEGEWQGLRWAWELRSVNGKGLDVRLRMPPGMDALEARLRKLAAERMSRGNLSGTLNLDQQGSGALRIDEGALDNLIAAAKKAAEKHGLKSPRVENLLGLKGVISIDEHPLQPEEQDARDDCLAHGFTSTLDGLVDMRLTEGRALAGLLEGQLEQIGQLVVDARSCAAASPEVIRRRLQTQIDTMLEGSNVGVEPERIAQEAAFLATKADVREELDRLSAHIDAARALIAGGSPAGRKLDFLAQEFAREANTLCAKAADPELSRIGLDLKAVIDQMREQIQNVE